MNYIRDTKVSRVVSTKITPEYNCLERIAKYCQSLGYISKATTSEITRFLLRAGMEWTSSHMNHRKAMNMTNKGVASEITNQLMKSRGNSSASAQNEAGDTGHLPIHDRKNKSSIVNIQQSSDIPHNRTRILTSDLQPGKFSSSLAQKVSLLDKLTQDLGGKMSNDDGPSLEKIGEYWSYLRQLPRPNYNTQF
jgi:hypothetical protein